MRKILALALVGMATAMLQGAQAGGGAVEVKGPHICCNQCVNVVGDILGKVEGVSDAKADQKGKLVTFTAKDEKAVKAGFKALVDGGFYGTCMVGGNEVKIDITVPAKGPKADVVTVKEVHVCCGQCQKAIIGIFKDSKVTFEGKGAQRTVRIEGKDLESSSVMETLHKTGFHGKAEK